MNILEFMNLPRFIEVSDVIQRFGQPLYKFEAQSYYWGNGIILNYSTMMFSVNNSVRVEYGNHGEFVTSIQYYANRQELLICMGIEKTNNESITDYEKIEGEFMVIPGIVMNNSYKKVLEYIKCIRKTEFFQIGEERMYKLEDKRFKFIFKYISFDRFTYKFFGHNDTTRLSAFDIILK